jgi:uncharacterized protein YqeY
MLPFEAQIGEAMKDAMRAKDQVRLDVLRGMKSALKYKHVEKEQKDLTDEEAFQVFQSMIKQRRDAAEQFRQFNRPESAQKEEREIEVITSFLPKPFSEEELSALIRSAIQASGALSVKDLGKVMKELKPKIVGRADSKKVTEAIQKLLTA